VNTVNKDEGTSKVEYACAFWN